VTPISHTTWVTKDHTTVVWGTPSIEHTTAILRWFVRRDEVSNHPFKELHRYQVNRKVHEKEGHEMGVNIEPSSREVLCASRTTPSWERCVKECAECNRRFRDCPARQQMAPLPRIRLEMTQKPFANCATDFAGPFYTMQGRGRPRMKRYLCLNAKYIIKNNDSLT